MILVIVLPAFVSCRAITHFLGADDVVAEVGMTRLYRSELDKVIPNGISPEDSARLAGQYIRSWASDHVFLKIAEEQLSKSEKDVSKELDDYRKSLLKYRYEQLYVNERLDTAVSNEEIEAYYLEYKENFRLQRPVVKARYLYISSDSPGFEPIRKRMCSSSVEDLLEADSLAYSAAMNFLTWSDNWIDASVLAREFNTGYDAMLASMDKSGWIQQNDTTGKVHLAYISEIMFSGEFAPMEFCAPAIRDMIVSSRKQAMLVTLEQDLLNDARENGQFVIF